MRVSLCRVRCGLCVCMRVVSVWVCGCGCVCACVGMEVWFASFTPQACICARTNTATYAHTLTGTRTQVSSVESFLNVQSKGNMSINFATWESAVYGFAHQVKTYSAHLPVAPWLSCANPSFLCIAARGILCVHVNAHTHQSTRTDPSHAHMLDAHPLSRAHTHTHRHTIPYTFARTHTHKHTRTRTHTTPTHLHTHTCTHTGGPWQAAEGGPAGRGSEG